jgi:DegV family protein with EDD domain
MSRVHIVTDSTAQFCTPGFAEAHAFTVVPLAFRFADGAPRASPELTTEQLFQRLAAGGPPPEVVAPSVEQFAAVYGEAARSTDSLLSIHVSSRLSTTVRQALAGSSAVKGRCKVEVVDSLSISAGLGALVEIAVLAAEQGASLDEVVRQVRAAVPRLYAVFFVETLSYLAQAGRADRAQAFLAEMLRVKPFLTIEEGELAPMEKTRNRLQALEKIIEFVTEFTAIRYLAVLQGVSGQATDVQQVRERLEAAYPGRRWPVLTYGPALATLLGPDALGVMVCEDEVEPE